MIQGLELYYSFYLSNFLTRKVEKESTTY